LTDIQQAISQQGKSWTAANHAIWQETWPRFRDMQGARLPYDSVYADQGWITPNLPVSFDWRNVGGTSYVSPIKDQGWCGSCWAFAAVGVLESLLMIRGYSPCGAENLSEQFVVSCNNLNLGCNGGFPKTTSRFMVKNSGLHFGAPDEACFLYTSGLTHIAPPCNNACATWLARDRSTDSFKFIRSSASHSHVAGGGAVDSMKSAIYSAPVWATFTVMEDFKAYSSGVYEYTTGAVSGGHAIIIVGWDDNNQCFICKNSWNTGWGENGFFRIGYSQLDSPVNFGAYTVFYDKAQADQASCWRYDRNEHTNLEWIPAFDLLPIAADEQILDVDLGFNFKFFCHFTQMVSLSSNGWLSTEPGQTNAAYQWFPIPDPGGPPAMIAPLWTDLDPSVSGPDKGIYTRNTGDGRFVIEFRNIARWNHPSIRETFETILYDPAVYPTATGEGRIRFQYLQHDPAQTFHTVGIEDQRETCGIQVWNDGIWPPRPVPTATSLENEEKAAALRALADQPASGGEDPSPQRGGTPIQPGMVVDFTPRANGDEFPPLPPNSVTASYVEPHVVLDWINPSTNTNGFPLSYLDGAVITQDGLSIAEILAAPGQTGRYEYRWAQPGPHVYSIRVRAGDRQSEGVDRSVVVPEALHYRDHSSSNVVFTVTDQGSCGFLDADQLQGSGFRFGPGGPNCLYTGSLCLATGPYTCVNRDYAVETYRDWQPVHSFSSAKEDRDEEFLTAYDDAGHPNPQGLVVTQRSRTWSQSPYNDFVMIDYLISNPGTTTAENLYVGQFMDWDVPITNPNNQGNTNAALRVAYMWQGAGVPYVGVALLSHDPANLTLIHNPTYVWPDAHLSDQERFYFLSAANPDHSVAQSWEVTDWSMMVSAGPFTIDPQGTLQVTLAVLGGADEADLLANAAAAREKYLSSSGVGEGGREIGLPRLLSGAPNPFLRSTVIHYTLDARSPVELRVFDASGRFVRRLVGGVQVEGMHEILWDGRDDQGQALPAGVYFYRLRTATWTDAKKVVLLKEAPAR
jgi:hypothetical protein